MLKFFTILLQFFLDFWRFWRHTTFIPIKGCLVLYNTHSLEVLLHHVELLHHLIHFRIVYLHTATTWFFCFLQLFIYFFELCFIICLHFCNLISMRHFNRVKLIGQILNFFATLIQFLVCFFVIFVFVLVLCFIFFQFFFNKLELLFYQGIEFLMFVRLLISLVFSFLTVTFFFLELFFKGLNLSLKINYLLVSLLFLCIFILRMLFFSHF